MGSHPHQHQQHQHHQQNQQHRQQQNQHQQQRHDSPFQHNIHLPPTLFNSTLSNGHISPKMSNEPKTTQSPALLKTAPPVSAIPTHRPNTNTQTLAAFPTTSSNTTSSAIPQHHSKGTGSQKQHTATTSSTQVGATSKSSAASTSQTESKPSLTDTPKEKPIRKKRGQYRKTILRQQAEAIETARAAGLPIPVFPPLDSGKSSKNIEKRPEASEELDRKEASSATVEYLDIRTNKPTQDRSVDRIVMERELAMLQEEAEEDLKKREQETNRALMRAQVVNHLRSLRSKLDPSQIKIGHNLRIQSVDMFSEIFNEVLGEIENDNSKVLESITTGFDAKEAGPSSEHLGHMLTRSSDKPRKMPKPSSSAAEPSTPSSHEPKNGFYGLKHGSHQSKSDLHQPKNGSHHYLHQRRRNSEAYQEETLHIESDDDIKPIKRSRQEKSSQFIGQSWDIGPGDDETRSIPKWRNTNQLPNALDVNSQRRPLLSTPQKARDINHLVRPAPRERESLQLRHRNELEQLQLLQRQEQEEFQRKQLDQLRDLQDRHSREFQEFEEANSRMFRERLASLADKRLQIMPAQHDRYRNARHKLKGESTQPSYEFSNGFYKQERSVSPPHSISLSSSPSPSHSPSPSRSQSSSSPSPSPSPPPSSYYHQKTDYSSSTTPSRTVHGRNGFRPTHGNLPPNPFAPSKRAVSTSVRQRRPNEDDEGFDGKPMSTMDRALSGMGDRKHQSKKSLKHEEQDSDLEVNLSNFTNAQSSSRVNTSNWNQKKQGALVSADSKNIAPYLSYAAPASPHTISNPARSLQSTNSKSALSSDVHHILSPAQPEEQSFTPKHSLKKRRHSQQRVEEQHTMDVDSASTPNAVGFNQDLLSHFKQWGSDGKNSSFLDLVLSDPPDIDVDDSEAEGILSEDLTGDFTLVKSNDVNTTPTSNAFRWYQEQQRLAQELSETPKMAPLQLQDFVTSSSGTQDNGQTFGNGLSSLSLDLTQNGHSTEQLIPGEDPLASYLFNFE